jgi:hypothetical protein
MWDERSWIILYIEREIER